MRNVLAIAAAVVAIGMAASSAVRAIEMNAVPPPGVDAPLAGTPGKATAVVAGGCFWGIEAVYRHVRGVLQAVSGYAGGPAASAHYEMVGTGRTGHAESVEVTYDPSKITYGQILRVFFAVAHDPTEKNRQGPDEGPQYRSAIFVSGNEQARIARAYIAQLDAAKVFKRPMATEVTPLPAFYAAEDYHQDYVALHPDAPYVMINDAPKVRHLKSILPDLYREVK